MCTCEFCHSEFRPRPQVKNPRACPGCQKTRQRSNENDWRKRNPKYSDPVYHKLQRELRKKRLIAVAKSLSECIRVGKVMLGLSLGMGELGLVLTEFLQQLGIRRVNKLCLVESTV